MYKLVKVPTQMRQRIIAVFALLVSSCWAGVSVNSADSVFDSMIDIAYVEPANPDFRPIYDALRRRRVLEELRLFLSPLRLPHRVLVKTDECGGAMKIPYRSGDPITVCYEYVAEIGRLAPPVSTPRGVSRENAIIGAFVQFVLHEMSYAIFDLLAIPVWGREDDAADKLVAFVLVQFDEALAIRVVTGAVWFFEASERTWTGSDFALETSPESQRFYNFLCIAYGGRPDAFREIVRDSLLQTRRAETCPHEYREERYAFRKTILPHVDPALLTLIRSMDWARPEN